MSKFSELVEKTIKDSLPQFMENWRLTRELERRIMAKPGVREAYMELRYHSQHPEE